MLVWGGVRAIYALPLLIIGLGPTLFILFLFYMCWFYYLLKDVNKFGLIWLIDWLKFDPSLVRFYPHCVIPPPLLRTSTNVTKLNTQWTVTHGHPVIIIRCLWVTAVGTGRKQSWLSTDDILSIHCSYTSNASVYMWRAAIYSASPDIILWPLSLFLSPSNVHCYTWCTSSLANPLPPWPLCRHWTIPPSLLHDDLLSISADTTQM